MLSKTRTTIITLVAAFSFAGASVVPTVAQARQKVPAGMSKAKFCAAMHQGYHLLLEEATNPENSATEREIYLREARADKQAAVEVGCAWATRESPTSAIVSPVGGLKGSPTPPPVTAIPSRPVVK